MRSKLTFLPICIVTLLAIAALTRPLHLHAQGYGQTITCSSDNGRRNYCNANTRGGVQMTRQISGSACIQGQTWGWDNNRIWVDKGCRAEFVTGNGNGGGWGGGGNNGQSITCSSDNGRRNYCNANTRGGVQMTRQISGSPCVQGQTWGWDNNRVWVDRGCRAEFVTGRGNGNGGGNGGGWGGGGNNGQSFTCSSDDGRRNYCNANTRGGVQMTRQISGSPCVQGQTWGWDNNRVWVDRGCRAEFVTGRGNGSGGGWGGGNGSGAVFNCSSDDGKRNYCAIPNGANPNSITMSRQISGSPCVQGQTWGVDGRGLWVDRGCRAEFRTNR
jgi:hypothetical protein